MALPVPTKSFLETSSDVAMLFAPFRCTHPPALSAEAEPWSRGHCRKWHHET